MSRATSKPSAPPSIAGAAGEAIGDGFREVGLIDCDVHLTPRSTDELIEYMSPPWRDRAGDRRRFRLRPAYLTLGSPVRLDSIPDDGSEAGSDPELVHRQLLVEEGADFGLVTPLGGYGSDPGFNAAVAEGLNAWQAATWLQGGEGRLLGSICVSIDDARRAALEVERWAGNPGFRQILIAHDADRPLGHPQYDPLWEAADRHGLPVAMHFNDSGRLSLGATPVGHFRHHVEYHSLSHPMEYAAHLVSWICSGTFARYPRLRVVFLEGGFLWHRPVIARLSHRWEAKSGYLPDASKDPINCLREHVRFATQPMEMSEDRDDLADALALAEADRLLMFSSDYPHFDYDHPGRIFPPKFGKDVRRRILSENAREFYGLPSHRPVGPAEMEPAR